MQYSLSSSLSASDDYTDITSNPSPVCRSSAPKPRTPKEKELAAKQRVEYAELGEVACSFEVLTTLPLSEYGTVRLLPLKKYYVVLRFSPFSHLFF